MKQYFISRMVAAGVVLLTVPAFAQKEKVKEEKTDKERQTIVINRSADVNEKTVIEINGDKITVNGKDVKDAKDVSVNFRRFKDFSSLAPTYAPGQWNMTFNDNDHISLFTEDSNRAMLGVVTEEADKGAEIVSVSKDSPAEKAGLKKGDVITRIGDSKVEDADDVSEAVKARKPGDKVAITVLRDGKEQRLNAELSNWKGVRLNANAISIPRVATPSIGMQGPNGWVYTTGRPKLGLSVQDTEDGKGVKVLDVDTDSPAAKAGLKENDIITDIDNKAVNSTDEMRALTRTTTASAYSFKVLRNGKAQTLEVKIPRKLKTADL